MPDISKISLPDGTTYNIKDSNALTDDLFNMTPIGVIHGGKYDPMVLNPSGLPLVTHNRPILMNVGDENTPYVLMFYYLNDSETGSTYEGYKMYGTIDTHGSFIPDTGSFIEYRFSISIVAINPQNGNIYNVFFKDLTNI